ncbi:hypothetical protein KSS87_006141 [Heliosperma pusillum]|nr:hypothetical protein KSS87_006141 [Heliosperma pusillum]
MVSMEYKGVKGMEQVIYNTQRLRADEIRHNLANTQLKENLSSSSSDPTKTDGPNAQLKEYVSDSNSSNISDATMSSYAKRSYMRMPKTLDWPELDPAFRRELACAALVEYQNTQGVKLEITGKVLLACSFHPSLCCFHLNFGVNDTTGTTKKMFAEVFKYKNGACKVNFCDIVDPTSPGMIQGLD